MDVREYLTANGKNLYRDWNVGLAKDLRDAAFAREFLLAAIDEGVDLQLALGKVIRAMGVKEFAARVRMARPKRVARNQSSPQSDAAHAQSSSRTVQTALEPCAAPGGDATERRPANARLG